MQAPADIIAAAKCWLSRWHGVGAGLIPVDFFHPSECAWCAFETAALLAIVEDFDPDGPDGAAFQRQPREAQRRQVRLAQGYDA